MDNIILPSFSTYIQYNPTHEKAIPSIPKEQDLGKNLCGVSFSGSTDDPTSDDEDSPKLFTTLKSQSQEKKLINHLKEAYCPSNDSVSIQINFPPGDLSKKKYTLLPLRTRFLH